MPLKFTRSQGKKLRAFVEKKESPKKVKQAHEYQTFHYDASKAMYNKRLKCERCRLEKRVGMFAMKPATERKYDTVCSACRMEIRRINRSREYKQCLECKNSKPMSMFRHQSGTDDGFSVICGVCSASQD